MVVQKRPTDIEVAGDNQRRWPFICNTKLTVEEQKWEQKARLIIDVVYRNNQLASVAPFVVALACEIRLLEELYRASDVSLLALGVNVGILTAGKFVLKTFPGLPLISS